MKTKLSVRYLVVGLIVGALWLAHRDEPLWEHGLRMLAILLAVPILVHLVLLAVPRRSRGSGGISLPRFAAAKAALVVVWLGVDWLLSQWTGFADIIVAAGLVLSVTVLGPRVHPYLMNAPHADRCP